MDLRQTKPIHLRCPDCGHDFSVNSNKIIQERQDVLKEIANLNKRIATLKEQNVSNKSPEYKRTVTRLEDAHMRASALKTTIRNISEHAELEKYRIFVKLVKNEIGEQRELELIKQAEDDLLYYGSYDMAIQKHTNFNNV